jgi:large subunit ribosomal protein L28
MSRKCELTGKKAMSGNNVSHAKNRTKRKFLPNLNNVTLTSDTLGRDFQFKVSASALRTINKVGGLDYFLKKVAGDNLSSNAMKIKKDIEKLELEKAPLQK